MITLRRLTIFQQGGNIIVILVIHQAVVDIVLAIQHYPYIGQIRPYLQLLTLDLRQLTQLLVRLPDPFGPARRFTATRTPVKVVGATYWYTDSGYQLVVKFCLVIIARIFKL